jgi:hypothetical protein
LNYEEESQFLKDAYDNYVKAKKKLREADLDNRVIERRRIGNLR